MFFFLLTFVINTSKNSSFESERGVASDLVTQLIITGTNIGERKEIKKLVKPRLGKRNTIVVTELAYQVSYLKRTYL